MMSNFTCRVKKVKHLKELFTEDILNLFNFQTNEESNSKETDETVRNNFREKVKLQFDNSTQIKKSKIEDEFFYQNGIKFLLKLMIKNEVDNKPISISTKETESNTTQINDALAPPYDEDLLIEEDFNNLGSHRLLFNKFAVMNEHVVLVTRQFQSQYTHLTYEDLENALSLMLMLDGVVFFNGGKDAGASQPRKHLQCIPIKSMYDGNFGIFLLIQDSQNLLSLNLNDDIKEFSDNVPFTFHQIKLMTEVEHLLVKFSMKNLNVSNKSKVYLQAFNICLHKLNLIEDEETLTQNYSVIIYADWMLVIARKNSRINLINGNLDINSIGFLFTLLCKSEVVLEEVKSLDIISEVYSKL